MLFLPVQSTPGATMPATGLAPSQPASRARNATATTLVMRPGSAVPSARPLANMRSVRVGVEQTVTTAGRHRASPVSPPPLQSPPPSAQRAASPKLAKYRGSLALNSHPKGARVLVNGVLV